MQEETATTTASPAGSHSGRLDEEDLREEGVVNEGPVGTPTPSGTTIGESSSSNTSDDASDNDDPHTTNEQQHNNDQSSEDLCDNPEDSNDNEFISPEDLLLKAVASSALRRDSTEMSLAPKATADARMNQPGSTIDKKDDDDDHHRDSASRRSWAVPPSWATRDRHVALPGAFAAPGQAQHATPTCNSVDNSDDESDNDEEEGEDGVARNDAARGRPPTLEATLVEDHQHSRNPEVVRAELLESQEFMPASNQDKAAPRPKRFLFYVVVGALVLTLVIGLTVVLTFVTFEKTDQDSNSADSDSKQQRVNDDEVIDSEDRGGRFYDETAKLREKGYDFITHHVAYVGWQTPRLCNTADNEPAVHVQCGGGNNDNPDEPHVDAEVKIWKQFSIVAMSNDSPCSPVNSDPPFSEFSCPSVDYYDNSTNTSTTITHLARIVFSCGARRSNPELLARVFVPKFDGYCGDLEKDEWDLVNITVALALRRICPVVDAYSDNGIVMKSFSTQCRGNATDTFPVLLVDMEDGEACRHQSEPCFTDDGDETFCNFNAFDYLAVEEWINGTEHENNEEEEEVCLSRLPAGLASLSEVYDQFFGNASNSSSN